MRKMIVLGVLAIACMLIGFASCDPKAKKRGSGNDVEKVSSIDVSRVTATDLEYMFANYGEGYRWYEECVLLRDYLDGDCDGTVAGVSNVFQVVEKDGSNYDTFVVLCAHASNGENSVEVKQGFWVEDFVLDHASIVLTFEQAYERLMESNYPKPHSRHCVLRKEVGPKPANPQYIFGNQQAQLYVDAVTGSVTDRNPVFD